MQKLQLYIENERVDLFNDESVSITQSIQNIKDISKIFTEFTKQFNVPASKKNNRIFKHYYNYDIVDGFDARIKKNAKIELNTIPFKNGKIKLDGVTLKNNKPHTYKITFFGNTVDLKDVLADKKLSSLLSLDTIQNLLYNSDQVMQYMTFKPEVNNFIVPLITHTQRLYFDSAGQHGHETEDNLYYESGTGHYHGVKWDQLKYAIRVRRILDAISDDYGLQFNSTFLNKNNPQFENLYMWLHRKKGDVSSGEQIDSFLTFIPDYTQTISGIGVSYFDLATNSIVITQDLDSQSLDIERVIFYVQPQTPDVQYRIKIFRDGQLVETTQYVTGTKTFNLDPRIFDAGSYQFFIDHTETIDVLLTRFEIIQDDGREINEDTFLSDRLIAQKVFEFKVTAQIPEMKIIDFLTAIFKMFNLTAYVTNDGVIQVLPLNDYYAAGLEYDITDFVDTNESNVDIALPYREITFENKETKTFLASTHNQLFNQKWGSIDYNNGESLDGGIYKIEIPFEHMKFERLVDLEGNKLTSAQWGYCVDDNQQSFIGMPIIFYANRIVHFSGTITSQSENKLIDTTKSFQTDGVKAGHLITNTDTNQQTTVVSVDSETQLTLVDDIMSTGDDYDVNTRISVIEDSQNHTFKDQYIIPSNSVALIASDDDSNINFGLMPNEWSGDSSFTGTLFNEFYSEYISDVFNTKNRLSKYTAYLPLKILFDLKLNDRVIINNRRYKINSMTTNLQSGKTDFELLNDL